MPITINEAREMLKGVVHEWWAQKARPLFGSQLKGRMLEKAPGFSEKSLGYKNFASFVRDCDGIAFRFRGTTDFAIVPANVEKALDEAPQSSEIRLRIRNDFWQAFVGFAVPNQIRAYDRATDKVYRGPADTIPPGALTIPPLKKEDQLSWRRVFVESLGAESPLFNVLPQLTTDGGFKAMADALESFPDLRRRWHSVLVHHVAATIRAWATPHQIPDELWLTQEVAAPVPGEVARKRVYELLDTIPVEQLLELRLPIRWLLDLPMTGKPKKE